MITDEFIIGFLNKTMIHNKYNKLEWHEKRLIDDVLKIFMNSAKVYNIRIVGDDRIEKVAEAMAECIHMCRPEK